ncbi:hypothetical protein [uncultured Endozoicomonas sp.]|uniref:hypothetical protein n=1 Tax=uncultured Endozoicomonas sp. TaxID=432652 RepID=UPI002607FA38|nr:hypothetical protein [uncultured Endozoicomonas sp.]
MTKRLDKDAIMTKMKAIVVQLKAQLKTNASGGNVLKNILGMLSYSLVIVLGVITLGACFLAGIIALIAAKLQDATEAEVETKSEPNCSPIVAA